MPSQVAERGLKAATPLGSNTAGSTELTRSSGLTRSSKFLNLRLQASPCLLAINV
jgi:hypothetical protein